MLNLVEGDPQNLDNVNEDPLDIFVLLGMKYTGGTVAVADCNGPTNLE